MSNGNRRAFIKSAAAVSLASALGPWPRASLGAAGRPNLIFILADDLGYADVSCYGRQEYVTPHIDALARGGVRLTHAYSNSALCTPTRVGFTTGRYQERTPIGLEEPLGARKRVGARVGLDPAHPTVPSLLGATGYRTALIGKWHMGYLPAYGPLKSGYQEFLGTTSGGVDYFTHRDGDGNLDLYEDETPVERVGYITDLITDRAVDYVRRRAADQSPFYLSLFYTAPHWPWEGPNDGNVSASLQELSHRDGGSLATYGEMVTRMDAGIGKVLAALTAGGLERNTLVVFGSDNGGERFSYLWPFWGQKGDLWEGGIRVPAIARWPGVIPENRISTQTSITMDWSTTFLRAASVAPHPDYPLDGIDLLPILTAKEPTVDRQLFWRMRRPDGQAAARDGHLKYLKIGKDEYLFDLLQDPRERANLAARRPNDFQRLKKLYDEWNAAMLPYPPETAPPPKPV